MSRRVHVAVGVIINADGQLLLAKRPAHLHQGGKWEFPGGKVEAGEHVNDALIRELAEEVNLQVHASSPFMLQRFDYPDKQVLLDIHLITEFSGQATGLEGQQVCWVSLEELRHYDFPAANTAIVDKLLSR
ncbi:8-oxo-dGTP diphosphatase MutT [Shewanella sp. NIFS-20-20]|uniref:8-oxo-dGTP diphosphatase MutT n=1 Tax=Shewanella sp. NIFS-20-20 TaxID=2853806 RepID=UPI001C4910B2|nr:8-oxo-dGTP diphosphatase MutT [Shewanella sp. NIFS-20-20]MBV7316457.1 8-oxo-dGTP diphosphatase MutT [Shewanella sp. NIFS-20-20]